MSLTRVVAFCFVIASGALLPCQELEVTGPDPTELAIGRESVVTLSVGAAPQLATLGPLPRMAGLTIAGGPPVRRAVGGVETLVTRPAETSHRGVPPDERAAIGIRDSLIRVSVGIEDVDDLVEDFTRALSG